MTILATPLHCPHCGRTGPHVGTPIHPRIACPCGAAFALGEAVRATDAPTLVQIAGRIASRVMEEIPDAPPPFIGVAEDGNLFLHWTTPTGDRGIIELGRGRYWWSLLMRSGDGDEQVELGAPEDAIVRLRAMFALRDAVSEMETTEVRASERAIRVPVRVGPPLTFQSPGDFTIDENDR